MVLKYTMLDTGLAGEEFVRPKGGDVQPEKNSSSVKKRVQFWLLLVANVIVFSFVYTFWTAGNNLHIWDLLTTNKGMISGIMYNAENPCAIVRGEVVHEGDTIDGYKVVKIHRDKVELEKNGRHLTKQVH